MRSGMLVPEKWVEGFWAGKTQKMSTIDPIFLMYTILAYITNRTP